ncbi:MAG: class I SAM-dependent methyltransferase, partial [Bacteroidota bacterium]
MNDKNNPTSTEQNWFESNRSLWNAKTPIHLETELYDLEAWRAGETSLKPAELEGLGDVSGKTLLHLQCHFGQDTLSWARLGAEVTGIDLSDESIATARRLAEEQGLEATFIQTNVYDLPDVLEGQFDIVFTSYGALPWLPDLDRWATLVRQYLKPGGTFFIAEFHPVIHMLEWDNYTPHYCYFNTGKPYEEVMEGTYADPDADLRH